MRTIITVGAAVGGAAVLAGGWGAPGWVSTAGLVVLALTAVAAGAGLVPQAPFWLRIVVALGSGVLAAALYGAAAAELPDDPVHLVLGAGCLLIAVVSAVRGRPRRASAGAHAR